MRSLHLDEWKDILSVKGQGTCLPPGIGLPVPSKTLGMTRTREKNATHSNTQRKSSLEMSGDSSQVGKTAASFSHKPRVKHPGLLPVTMFA